ncbi:hypothetical protein BpHYR1_037203 [Brachionus plicatilis]|uniref:Uncharacterized protein n=1 Tax=Brachionus plicatilis TaxID=10195 RepID=A0A3M7SI97_BRAPC|nr:hypothetical protein BpHYR1_037203 [Brachionus plicatilis]
MNSKSYPKNQSCHKQTKLHNTNPRIEAHQPARIYFKSWSCSLLACLKELLNYKILGKLLSKNSLSFRILLESHFALRSQFT